MGLALLTLFGASSDTPSAFSRETAMNVSPPIAVRVERQRWAAPHPDIVIAATRARPLHVANGAEWSQWLQAANAGDPGAACRLALMLDDCRLVREVDGMVDTQVSMAAAGEIEPAHEARDIAALQASVESQRSRCAVLPSVLLQHDADFLLRAALAGHEPSMLRYLVDPPLAAPSAPERAAALETYRQHADGFLEALLRRASPDALALAFRIAQGEEFVAGHPIRARDAAAAARYATALLMLREDDAPTLIGLETALSQLDADSGRRAQLEGRRMAALFLIARPQVAAAPASDECATGWPGLNRAVTASAF